MRALTGKIGRYIAWRFLVTILGVYALCLSLIFLIDFIELLRQSGKYGSVPAHLLIWMGLLRLPAYGELTLPFAALVGSIAAFVNLSRKSELIVIRAAGLSVWQFALPGIVVAFLIGVVSITLYNPLAALARAESERMRAEAFGRNLNIFRTKNAGSWLRQEGADGPSVLSAQTATNNGLTLKAVAVFQFDRDGRFLARVDADSATLKDGYWSVAKAWVTRARSAPEFFEHYQISTYLSPAQVTDAMGSVISISFWQFPRFIELAEKSGLPATRHKVQHTLLMARPATLAAMVLLAATVSLRAFRFGNIQTMVVVGLVAGFGFFILAEMSRQVGVAGLTPPAVAIWVPIAVAVFGSLTVLLYQEDG